MVTPISSLGTASPAAAQGTTTAGSFLEDLSSTLGLGPTAIEQQLAAGSSLSQIAANQGVSQSTLLSAVEGALSAGPDQGLSSTQLSTLADDIVNRTGPPGGHHAFAGAPGTASADPVSTSFLLTMIETAPLPPAGVGPPPYDQGPDAQGSASQSFA